MKIYCSQRNKTDEEILDSLVGKDAWLLVRLRMFGNAAYFIKIRSKCEDTLDPCYKVVMIGDYRNMSGDGAIHLRADFFESMILLSTGTLLYDYDIRIIKPVDIMSTDELFALDPSPEVY